MTDKQIDLLCFSHEFKSMAWELGDMFVLSKRIGIYTEFLKKWSKESKADYLLCWDIDLGYPDISTVIQAGQSHYDICHAGLLLGMNGLPRMLDFINPTWMFSRDADPEVESNSWRMTFDSCLFKRELLLHLGFPDAGYETMEYSALDFGHRCIRRGALIRHIPRLLANRKPSKRLTENFHDEMRFIKQQYGNKWHLWATVRAILNGLSVVKVLNASRRVAAEMVYDLPSPYQSPKILDEHLDVEKPHRMISVLIPTLNRYSYLQKVLEDLRLQTVKPFEIIVVDQSRKEIRDPKFYDKFPDLPIRVIFQDEPGQCSSRNVGLKVSKGDFVLFLDDDVEIPPDLIEKHLNNLHLYQCDVSSGVADEVGAELPEDFKYLRLSDGFPTNNTMIKKGILKKSGLFDLAYDRKQRADGDLGMRIYLSGAYMISDPAITLFHHHAPEGGLRQHKARVKTYAASRESLWIRNLPSDSEIYLASRYFTPRQVREFIALTILGTFSIRGGFAIKTLKALIGLIMLPSSYIEVIRAKKSAERMLVSFPAIGKVDM